MLVAGRLERERARTSAILARPSAVLIKHNNTYKFSIIKYKSPQVMLLDRCVFAFSVGLVTLAWLYLLICVVRHLIARLVYGFRCCLLFGFHNSQTLFADSTSSISSLSVAFEIIIKRTSPLRGRTTHYFE